MKCVYERVIVLFVIVLSYTCVSAGFFKSLKHKSIFNKRENLSTPKRTQTEAGAKLVFNERLRKEFQGVGRHRSLVLECQGVGSPNPTVHWLKNGEPISDVPEKGPIYEDTIGKDGLPLLRLSSTSSKLTLDCLTEAELGDYTCVAETNFHRISQTTTVKREDLKNKRSDSCLLSKAMRGEPARITMWTKTRVEFQENSVQLFCRAEGSPTPTIQWFNPMGRRIVDGRHYTIADNGDMIIKNMNWSNMGVYTCVAENSYGSDKSQAFLYPTFRDEDDEEEILP